MPGVGLATPFRVLRRRSAFGGYRSPFQLMGTLNERHAVGHPCRGNMPGPGAVVTAYVQRCDPESGLTVTVTQYRV